MNRLYIGDLVEFKGTKNPISNLGDISHIIVQYEDYSICDIFYERSINVLYCSIGEEYALDTKYYKKVEI